MKHKEVSCGALERIEGSLRKRYDSFSQLVERIQDINECTGSYRYASLIGTVRERTKDREIIRDAWKTLHEIADHPYAGRISWEMRRYIRRAPPELLPELFQVVREYAKVDPGYWIDMDDFYFNPSPYEAREMLECMKRGLERAKHAPKEHDSEMEI